MIRSPTVLVLGAGASQPYNFPTGEELKQLILSGHLEIDRRVFGAVPDWQVQADRFRELFRWSKGTIDEFLETNPAWLEPGKGLIAAHIIKKEEPEHLHPKTADWMGLLFRWMAEGTSADTFASNRLSVVSLNYDRSFEFALSKFIEGRFHRDPFDAHHIASKFPVIHIHGQVGPLWSENGRYESEFKSDLEGRWRWRSDIRIIHDPTDDELLEKARTLLMAAKRVFCLGFGYHHTTVQRLFGSPLREGTEIRGTCKGLCPAELRAKWRLFPARQVLENPESPQCRIKFADTELDCLDFLRHHADIFTR